MARVSTPDPAGHSPGRPQTFGEAFAEFGRQMEAAFRGVGSTLEELAVVAAGEAALGFLLQNNLPEAERALEPLDAGQRARVAAAAQTLAAMIRPPTHTATQIQPADRPPDRTS